MLAVLGIGLLALLGWGIYLAVMAVVWVNIVVFFFWTILFDVLLNDAYLGFFIAFPMTFLTWWLLLLYGESRKS